jgi:hypothetical protein
MLRTSHSRIFSDALDHSRGRGVSYEEPPRRRNKDYIDFADFFEGSADDELFSGLMSSAPVPTLSSPYNLRNLCSLLRVLGVLRGESEFSVVNPTDAQGSKAVGCRE